MSNDRIVEKAHLLLREIRAALARGTKHYGRDGRLLTTEKEIVLELLEHGGLTFEPAKPHTLRVTDKECKGKKLC